MEPRISLITLGVSDLERSKAFYQDILGWQAAEGPPGVVFFDLGGLVFSLYPHEELAKDHGGESRGPGSQGFALAHNVRSEADVDAIFRRLVSHGATIVKPPQKVFWGGYSGYFADPDGHLWEVAHNPFWTILPDGRIALTPPGESR